MQYRNIYTNHLLKIKISTNSKIILRLVDNYMDFTGINLSKPKIKIDFYLDEVNSKDQNNDKNFPELRKHITAMAENTDSLFALPLRLLKLKAISVKRFFFPNITRALKSVSYSSLSLEIA